jgi:rare lipoprotein A
MRKVITAVVLAALAAGCAETRQQGPTSERSFGRFKIGAPYKVNGRWYYPALDYDYVGEGIASWYGPDFHGKPTANGEIFDMNELTAAHPTMALPSIAEVTNLENGRSVKLLVNDRGPFVGDRVIDVSRRAAQLLGFHQQGIARVRVAIVADESRALHAQLIGHPMPVVAALPPSQPASPSRPGGGALPAEASVGFRPETRELASLPFAGGPPSSAAPTAAPEPTTKQSSGFLIAEAAAAEPPGWFVQTGAFAERQNAERIRSRLSHLGSARISPVERNGQELFRVRLGPLPTVHQADRLLTDVEQAGVPEARVVYE